MFRPGCGLGVERTFHIVTLVADHLADTHDQLGQRLAGAPVVANANLLRIHVRMKYRCDHPAERRAARIIQRQENLRPMGRAHREGVFCVGNQPLEQKLEHIFLRRVSLSGENPDMRMLSEGCGDAVKVSLQSPQARVHWQIRIRNATV